MFRANANRFNEFSCDFFFRCCEMKLKFQIILKWTLQLLHFEVVIVPCIYSTKCGMENGRRAGQENCAALICLAVVRCIQFQRCFFSHFFLFDLFEANEQKKIQLFYDGCGHLVSVRWQICYTLYTTDISSICPVHVSQCLNHVWHVATVFEFFFRTFKMFQFFFVQILVEREKQCKCLSGGEEVEVSVKKNCELEKTTKKQMNVNLLPRSVINKFTDSHVNKWRENYSKQQMANSNKAHTTTSPASKLDKDTHSIAQHSMTYFYN